MPSHESYLLDSGTYGCAFNPPIRCKKQAPEMNKFRNKIVGKVLHKDGSVVELDIAAVVKGIVGWKRYYIVQTKDVCDSRNFATIRKDYEDECEIIGKHPDKNLVQLLSPYGGYPLSQARVNSSFDYLGNFRHMIEAIAKLETQGVCHYDLKENNILVDSAGTLRIIDFGSAFLGDQVRDQTVSQHQYDFQPSYYPQPPELSVQNAIYDRKPGMKEAIRATIEKKTIFKMMENILAVSMESSEKELETFWNEQDVWNGSTGSSDSASPDDWVPFFQTYWRTWDSWAVGAMFLRLLQTCFLQKSFVEGTWKEYGAIIRQVLKGLLRADPRNRLTGVEAEKLLRMF